VVALRQTRLVPGWVTVLVRIKHLGTEPDPLHMPCQNGKEGWGQYPGVGDALLTRFLLEVQVHLNPVLVVTDLTGHRQTICACPRYYSLYMCCLASTYQQAAGRGGGTNPDLSSMKADAHCSLVQKPTELPRQVLAGNSILYID